MRLVRRLPIFSFNYISIRLTTELGNYSSASAVTAQINLSAATGRIEKCCGEDRSAGFMAAPGERVVPGYNTLHCTKQKSFKNLKYMSVYGLGLVYDAYKLQVHLQCHSGRQRGAARHSRSCVLSHPKIGFHSQRILCSAQSFLTSFIE